MKELFTIDKLCACELGESDIPDLQKFFDANPEYFVAVNGMLPRADEAWQEFNDRPPPGMSYDKQLMIAFVDDDGQWLAIASVLSNFIADSVWHIGLFIVATRLHGGGVANATYAALEDWMRGHGAQWIRLGVVLGNQRAERFWQRAGYAELRLRTGIQTGNLVSTIRVMMKPLCGGASETYLLLVGRDRDDDAAS